MIVHIYPPLPSGFQTMSPSVKWCLCPRKHEQIVPGAAYQYQVAGTWRTAVADTCIVQYDNRQSCSLRCRPRWCLSTWAFPVLVAWWHLSRLECRRLAIVRHDMARHGTALLCSADSAGHLNVRPAHLSLYLSVWLKQNVKQTALR